MILTPAITSMAGDGNDYLDLANFGTDTPDDILIGGSGEDWIASDGIAVGGDWGYHSGNSWSFDFSQLPTGDGEADAFSSAIT